MGEAKRRQAAQDRLIYHHTSSLRTNQLWMSGYVLPEGQMPPVLHPKLGEIQTNASLRRAMKDFPPLAWFTKRIEVPNVLLNAAFLLQDESGATVRQFEDRDLSNALALNRLAFGFDRHEIAVVPWPEHPGYTTAEGIELNESAIASGDDPTEWWVSEEAVDLMQMVEIRVSRSIMKPKLERHEGYLSDVKRMVSMCRERKDVFIPPAWLPVNQAKELARRVGASLKTDWND